MNEKNAYEIIRFDTIPSTSDYAKQRRGEGKNLWITAKTQTGGRGTKGRSFSSSSGGLYATSLRFYENFPAKNAFQIMQHTAVAVCETLARFSIQAKIKWPNDIFVNGKKICGILTENTFAGNALRCSCVGIGLNINNELEKELLPIATTLKKTLKKTVDLEQVESVLLEKFYGESLAGKYATYLGWIGERVKLITPDGEKSAVVLGVNEIGELIAEIAGETQTFPSAEVSLRI